MFKPVDADNRKPALSFLFLLIDYNDIMDRHTFKWKNILFIILHFTPFYQKSFYV